MIKSKKYNKRSSKRSGKSSGRVKRTRKQAGGLRSKGRTSAFKRSRVITGTGSMTPVQWHNQRYGTNVVRPARVIASVVPPNINTIAKAIKETQQ